MNRFFKILAMAFVLSPFFFSCAKEPLTLDKETSMKTLLKASDDEITELVIKEAIEKGNVSEENIDVAYILRDEKTQAIAVKLKINKK